MKRIKRQTAVKGRFSAVLISAAVHVAVLIAAGTFVAVTVVQRQEARFEGRQVSRPRMQLQRLQVPQRARQERQAPQMSQRVTAQAVSTRSIDFQMPEIAGLGGGISVDMSGAGFSGSLGFATPQLNLFGLRSSGEKVLFLLDTNESMMVDLMGGIPAYRIIKNELIGMIERLPPTALFNVIVFDLSAHKAFSAEPVAALPDTIRKLKEWLAPLNEDKAKFGLSTLAHPGVELEFERMAPIPNIQPGWPVGLSHAIQYGYDTIYWLGTDDRMQWIHRDLYADAKRGRPIEPITGQPEESMGLDYSSFPGGEARWQSLVAQARQMHEQENARRRAAGQPERVPPVGGTFGLVNLYLPGTPQPQRIWHLIAYRFSGQDVAEYVQRMQQKYSETDRRTTSVGLRSGRRLHLNVVHFVPLQAPGRSIPILEDASRRLRGSYIQITGLEEIRSAAQSSR